VVGLKHILMGLVLVLAGFVVDAALRWHFYGLWPTRAPVGMAFLVPLGVLVILLGLVTNMTEREQIEHRDPGLQH